MLTIYTCITTQHDLRLVGLAAAICLLASFSAVTLLHHVRRSQKGIREIWLAVAATATGFGIWATHFIAMLAFQPAVPTGYNIVLTVASLIAAILLTGVGLSIGVSSRIRAGRWIGGGIVGGGIAVMHYTGMAAYEIEGRILWDMPLVVASIIMGGAFGAAALPIALQANRLKYKLLGATMLTVAICSHHFTAMSAAAIELDPRIDVSASAVPSAWLAMSVAFVSTLIIALALTGILLDLRERRRAAGEVQRMRELADAAVEGLLICDDEGIVAANRSFSMLASVGELTPIGRSLKDFFPAISRADLSCARERPLETVLQIDGSDPIPVELIQRRVTYNAKLHRAIAVRDIRERKKAEMDIYFLAHHDPLTELPNRASFNKRLAAEIALHQSEERRFAVMFLDLDRFKEVNDLFGHPAGDAVLQFMAKRIQGVLEYGQIVARLGGDEFAVIVPQIQDTASVAALAERIIDAIDGDDKGLPAGVSIGTSIGIAFFPSDGTDREVLLGHADAALYEAKAAGRGMYRVFEPSMGAYLRNRRELEYDLRHAVSREELSLVYQPQAELQSGKIFGFEALLRWNHATKGIISPAEFIPIAEECGAILQIGEWVLRIACKEAVSWDLPLTIAVNVSAAQLHGGDLPDLVEKILNETGLDPARLELEITETALIKDHASAIATLSKLKALGVRIAMDDFGTGYSSLSNLRVFPFDRIKIDQSFVRAVDTSPEAAAIVRAVVGLAKGLDLPVLAEGVETAAELKFLRQEACTSMQGYLLGRPGPISDFVEHTKNHDDIGICADSMPIDLWSGQIACYGEAGHG